MPAFISALLIINKAMNLNSVDFVLIRTKRGCLGSDALCSIEAGENNFLGRERAR